MHTPGTETRTQGGVGEAAKSVAEHMSAILRLEAELATMELTRKLKALGIGIGLALGAALFLLFMLGFALAAAAAALATAMSTWLALLIVTGALLALAGLLGVLALGRFRRGTPPVPEQAIREAKLTTEALKSDGTGT
jgi:protein-S-isoprenylcysteine O-methyltransferase Ste14